MRALLPSTNRISSRLILAAFVAAIGLCLLAALLISKHAGAIANEGDTFKARAVAYKSDSICVVRSGEREVRCGLPVVDTEVADVQVGDDVTVTVIELKEDAGTVEAFFVR